MREDSRYFKLYSNCIAVKGYSRSTICDLQKGHIHFIPNDLQEILISSTGKSLLEVKKDFDYSDHEVIDEYFNFLEKAEVGAFYTHAELSLYPAIDFTFELPCVIQNSIIDIGEQLYDYSQVVKDLDMLGCRAIQLRIFKTIRIKDLFTILNNFNGTRIRSIELYLKYDAKVDIDFVNHLINEFPRITVLITHSCPVDIQFTDFQSKTTNVTYTVESLGDESHCGFISPNYFLVNLKHFSESLSANNCLNQKVSIDQYGFFRNCPAMPDNFGHISDTSIFTVIENPVFAEKWHIAKDQITICQDCEFRYVCSDCRAFVSEPLNHYSKPAKCSYNPYLTEWQ